MRCGRGGGERRDPLGRGEAGEKLGPCIEEEKSPRISRKKGTFPHLGEEKTRPTTSSNMAKKRVSVTR